MGRPKGSRNRSSIAIDGVLMRLEADGSLDIEKVLRGLYLLAVDHPDPSIRIRASRELLDRKYGTPQAKLEMTHKPGGEWQAVLRRVLEDPERRKRVADLESWRRRRLIEGAIEAEKVPDPPKAS
jgi:hypothetical protein